MILAETRLNQIGLRYVIMVSCEPKGETMATLFQHAVWKALEKIPSGKVTSYAALARYLETRAVRAVGSAVGKNPNAPQVPCHRVVRGDGTIGNYSGGEGVATKIRLLSQEGVETSEGKIVDFDTVFWEFTP